MSTPNGLSGLVHRTLVLMTILGAGAALSAQTPAQTSNQPATTAAQPSLSLQAPAIDTAGDSLFSSSTAEAAGLSPGAGAREEASLSPLPVNFANAMQYGGGQRRYGRPRYRGGNSNQDGSSKYTFVVGGGFTQPLGNTWHYDTPSYGLEVGVGRNFSSAFALLVQFDYDNFGFTGQTLANQLAVENQYIAVYNASVPSNQQYSPLTSLDGNSHVWSFTLDPTITLAHGDAWGSYFVGGVGFYHKTANFFIPQIVCNPFYGICYSANQSVDKYTSNAPGFNGGFGLTYKFSRFSNERFFVEVRYVFVDDAHRPGFSVKNAGSITPTSTNLFPANSNRTTYLPVKFGIRF